MLGLGRSEAQDRTLGWSDSDSEAQITQSRMLKVRRSDAQSLRLGRSLAQTQTLMYLDSEARMLGLGRSEAQDRTLGCSDSDSEAQIAQSRML